ncbi:MAG: serine hydrolase, partial [Intestinibacter sp.]|uniref:D-alanyl-D-alanine carboxypeptidase family protein n=1 Tax=Intestinibacter sp. TaxID=1965304 RepID=UPI0025C1F08A
MKKKLSYLLVCLLTTMMIMSSSILAFADEAVDSVDIKANYGVVIDYETGKVLGGKNIDSRVFPASTTKIWTAYLVVKNVKNLNDTVEIKEDPMVDGSSMYLKKGEIFTVKELLQGLLIHSSNDAAEVLAKYVSGSIEDFANLMNEEAKKAGALNTHFNNPHGLPDENHYTTPYDMAMLARKAMSEEVIREIVSTKSISFKEQDTATSKVAFSRYFTNTNLFLTSNDKITYRGKSI